MAVKCQFLTPISVRICLLTSGNATVLPKMNQWHVTESEFFNLIPINFCLISLLEYQGVIGLVIATSIARPPPSCKIKSGRRFDHRLTDSGTPYGPSIPARHTCSPEGSRCGPAFE
ncbi:hypothetical protein CDAR_543591 [Caerostris darwini]|uniref:Uncharacterized protein n=1 Tax=Caerostris darwini TaxID=1538125 RepID=A0AAV4V1S3_9ARAC|nr:hypothetical protein CDAR_543591 [Caerostris darwini]